MDHNITVDLSSSGILMFGRRIEEFREWLEDKTTELLERFAEIADEEITFEFDHAAIWYDGDNWYQVTSEWTDDHTITVRVSGTAVLFIEFGAGIRYSGFGHPEAAQNGMGPGTYPGSGHWDDPRGWWFTDPATGETIHSYGNPAGAPVYNAMRTIEQDFERIVSEVFNG